MGLFLSLLVGCADSNESGADANESVSESTTLNSEEGTSSGNVPRLSRPGASLTDANMLPVLPGRAALTPEEGCVQPEASETCTDGYCTVQPGCFIMGGPPDEPPAAGISNVQIQATITNPFLLGETELTREAWLETGWGLPERNVQIEQGSCEESNCPVTNVSFFDALRYANWLSEQQGLELCCELGGCSGQVGLDLECTRVFLTTDSPYECTGYRLPTEAEWEYAARAGQITAFYSGDMLAAEFGECVVEPNLEEIAWYCANSGMSGHAVGLKRANGWGLHDMLGNVFEWTSDLFYGLGYGESPQTDPVGIRTPGRDLAPPAPPLTLRVFRGGDYALQGVSCAAARRTYTNSKASSSAIGFRLARSLMR